MTPAALRLAASFTRAPRQGTIIDGGQPCRIIRPMRPRWTKPQVRLLALGLVLGICACTPSTSPATPGPSVTIVNKGSDTMVNLALAWAEAYHAARPSVNLSVTGGGSGTGIAALVNRTVDLANASRAIKPEERAEAEARGVESIEHVVARDAIAVIVHRDNPVQQLTLQQISDIYSGKINRWSQVGGLDRPIVRLSRETNSGTHVYFLEQVIRLGNPDDATLFAADTLLLPSSEGINSELSYNENAIGYDGLGYVTDAVRVLAIARSSQDPYTRPSTETVNNGTYPISRDLYMYSAGQAEGEILAYLQWILSSEGQAIVADQGFVPVGG
jgi:phosphate transport system substrate-binding protein